MFIRISEKPSETFLKAFKDVIESVESLDLLEKNNRPFKPDSKLPEFVYQFEKGLQTLGNLDRSNAILLAADMPTFHKRLVLDTDTEAYSRLSLTYKVVGFKVFECFLSDLIPRHVLRQAQPFAQASHPICEPLEPLRDCWLKSYDLYKAIHQTDPKIGQFFPSHNLLWVLAISAKCKRGITMAGMARRPIAGLPTQPPGKNKAYEERLSFFDRISELNPKDLQPLSGMGMSLQYFDTWLAQLGNEIAARDNDFSQLYWKPYVDAEKRLSRFVNNSPTVQYLREGL
jgi:hypothetical protein